ncbi:MAG: hypothetical protein KF887_15975 [Paracoccaceae bacterium]|nr:MAG: hypothetical protein KF887_15975 [Paracoccaceae bacterium]
MIARLYPSGPRRAFGVAVLVALGAMLVWIAMARPPEALGWRLFLLGFGAFVLWAAVRLWQATAIGLELTEAELREEGGGRVLAAVARIRGVSRGALAFKPSNGFLITLDGPAPRVWAPGLWWRLGRRLGVGGVTSGQEARFMAETIAALIARRDGGDPR